MSAATMTLDLSKYRTIGEFEEVYFRALNNSESWKKSKAKFEKAVFNELIKTLEQAL